MDGVALSTVQGFPENSLRTQWEVGSGLAGPPGEPRGCRRRARVRDGRDRPGCRVSRAHEAGLEVHVWTVNEVDDIEFCLALGVDAITSDHPDRVLGLVSR